MHKIRVESLLLVASLVMVGMNITWADQTPAGSSSPKPAPTAAAQTTAAKPVAPSKPAKAPAKSPAVRSTAAKAPHHVVQKAGKASPASTQKKGQAEQKATKTVAGRRDPFKLPVVGEAGGAVSEVLGPLPPGTRGLVISQLQLEGIVRLDTTKAMIAVVSNPRKLAYFLRENDAVYNGVVSRITPDAVYFKENHLDANGQVTSMEVVKRLSPAPGEGK